MFYRRPAWGLALALGCVVLGAWLAACRRGQPSTADAAPFTAAKPSILLITLDTTRADAIGPEAIGVETPAFNALAARGRRYRQAYATVPETLPSHISMMTGLYPGGHGIHENARFLPVAHPVAAERLQKAGYHTSAFVSSFALARRFGLARGFDRYDDEMAAGLEERSGRATTDAVIAELSRPVTGPRFVWAHYYDPHYPYEPPEPLRGQFLDKPYLGEVASMDEQMGRLIQAFEARAAPPVAIIVVADHGEGLGDHGERLHGNLLYQSTMRVPLVVMGPGMPVEVSDEPVSVRRVFHTLMDWAGLGATDSLRGAGSELVLGEAMKPFLEYGWQPQVMAIDGGRKAILAGTLEAYDLAADPLETRNLGSGANLPAPMRARLEDYPVPSPEAARPPDNLDDDARRRLASLGYVSGAAAPVVRKDAPRPADMTGLFDVIDQASGMFVREEYSKAVPLFERILAADPFNLDATLRLATAASMLGRDARASAAFQRAREIAPSSPDVGTYLALHYARGPEWERAAPLLEQVIAASPERLPALEAMAVIRERQGRDGDAVTLRRKIHSLRQPAPAELIQLGRLAMAAQQTDVALESFEAARGRQGGAFAHDLELGVLYLAARRFAEAAVALDRVPSSHPDHSMALFKRAQVSVLLNEPDRAARIATARQKADRTTRPLIAAERLFREDR